MCSNWCYDGVTASASIIKHSGMHNHITALGCAAFADQRPTAPGSACCPKSARSRVETYPPRCFQHASSQLRYGHGSYDPGWPSCPGATAAVDAVYRNRFKVTAESTKPAAVIANSLRHSFDGGSRFDHHSRLPTTATDSYQDVRNHLKSSLSVDGRAASLRCLSSQSAGKTPE